jgi:transposase
MSQLPLALSERIVGSYLDGEGTMEEIADRFRVHRNTVYNLTKRFRERHTLAPRPYRRGPRPLLTDEVLAALEDLVIDQNDRTQAEYAELLKERSGVALSKRSISRALHRLRMSRKKKRWEPTRASTPSPLPSESPSWATWAR